METWYWNAFQGGSTIKDLLEHPEDGHTSGVIYRYKWRGIEWKRIYQELFTEMFREHMIAPSSIHDHHNIPGYDFSIENFSTVGKED